MDKYISKKTSNEFLSDELVLPTVFTSLTSRSAIFTYLGRRNRLLNFIESESRYQFLTESRSHWLLPETYSTFKKSLTRLTNLPSSTRRRTSLRRAPKSPSRTRATPCFEFLKEEMQAKSPSTSPAPSPIGSASTAQPASGSLSPSLSSAASATAAGTAIDEFNVNDDFVGSSKRSCDHASSTRMTTPRMLPDAEAISSDESSDESERKNGVDWHVPSPFIPTPSVSSTSEKNDYSEEKETGTKPRPKLVLRVKLKPIPTAIKTASDGAVRPSTPKPSPELISLVSSDEEDDSRCHDNGHESNKKKSTSNGGDLSEMYRVFRNLRAQEEDLSSDDSDEELTSVGLVDKAIANVKETAKIANTATALLSMSNQTASSFVKARKKLLKTAARLNGRLNDDKRKHYQLLESGPDKRDPKVCTWAAPQTICARKLASRDAEINDQGNLLESFRKCILDLRNEIDRKDKEIRKLKGKSTRSYEGGYNGSGRNVHFQRKSANGGMKKSYAKKNKYGKA